MTNSVPTTQQEVGAWLRELRGNRTQAEIALAADTTERTVIRWEKEGIKAVVDVLRYLRALGVSIDPAPPVAGSAADELLQRLEQAVLQIEAALAARRSPPAAPPSLQDDEPLAGPT